MDFTRSSDQSLLDDDLSAQSVTLRQPVPVTAVAATTDPSSLIIKQASRRQNRTASHEVIKAPVVAAKAEADRLLAAARTESAAIRQKAVSVALKARETAWQQGHEQALAAWNQYLLAAYAARDRVIAEAEQEILRLAVRMAEKIIGHELKSQPETIAEIVATSLHYTRAESRLTVRVSPVDLPMVEQFREKFEGIDHIRFIRLLADPQVEQGGCLIETETEIIDARLSTQMRALEHALISSSQRGDK